MKNNTLPKYTDEQMAELFDQILAMQKAGHSEAEISAKFDDGSQEVAQLLNSLNAAKILLSTPKNTAPTPLMQRRYLEQTHRAFFHLSRFSTFALSVSFIVSGMVATGFVANQSSPGEALFAVKKTTEKLPLVFTINQDARASLQIHIAEKRLIEAQVILNDPSKSEQQKTAMLNELSDQTSNAVSELSQVTKNNPKSENNQPLISSLDKIAKQQQQLLEQIKPDSSITVATNKALETLNETSAQISEIKHTVAVADSDQKLASLAANPAAVVVLGQITKIEDRQITVEKTVFTLTPETVIQNLNGVTFSRSDLSKKQRVSISGIKDKNNVLIATSIVITQTGLVEGESTQGQSSTTPSDTPKIPEPTPTPNSNNAVGTFIFEDPAPQFIK